jgi:phosphoheptose isomerase
MMKAELNTCNLENNVFVALECHKSIPSLQVCCETVLYSNVQCKCSLRNNQSKCDASKIAIESTLLLDSNANHLDRLTLDKLISQATSIGNDTLCQMLQPKLNGQSMPTEQRNNETTQLSTMNSAQICDLMWKDTLDAQQILRQYLPLISQLIDNVLDRLKEGGRLLYVGAGSSGRLAVLDAVECPPTFGCSTDQVQGIFS